MFRHNSAKATTIIGVKFLLKDNDDKGEPGGGRVRPALVLVSDRLTVTSKSTPTTGFSQWVKHFFAASEDITVTIVKYQVDHGSFNNDIHMSLKDSFIIPEPYDQNIKDEYFAQKVITIKGINAAIAFAGHVGYKNGFLDIYQRNEKQIEITSNGFENFLISTAMEMKEVEAEILSKFTKQKEQKEEKYKEYIRKNGVGVVVIALPGELAFSVRKNIREKNFQLVEDMSSGREMSREPGFFLLRPSYSGESYDIDEIKTKMFVKGVGQKEVTEFLRYYNLGEHQYTETSVSEEMFNAIGVAYNSQIKSKLSWFPVFKRLQFMFCNKKLAGCIITEDEPPIIIQKADRYTPLRPIDVFVTMRLWIQEMFAPSQNCENCILIDFIPPSKD